MQKLREQETISLQCYLEALQTKKYSFRTLQKELTSRNMPSAQGWEPLFEKYKDPSIKKSDKGKWSLILKELYDNHIRYGSKAIFMFEIDRKLALKIADSFPGMVDQESPFRTSFPFVLDDESLKKTSLKPSVTLVEPENDRGSRLICCYKRAYKEREQIELESLNTDAIKQKTILEAFTDFEEIYGIRCGFTQSFDCIVIRPDEERLELQIDHCRQLNTDDLIKSFYKKLLNIWIEDTFKIKNALNSPINFYPILQKLYKEDDGKIFKLGHVTGTDSIKEERMRRGHLDLREEPFHKKGLQAVVDTDPFSLTKKWDSEHGTTSPSVTIPGYSSHAGASDAKIEYVIINDCSCKQDFEMVLDKLF